MKEEKVFLIKLILFFIFIILFNFKAFSHGTIIVSGVEHNKGYIDVKIYTDKESFLKEKLAAEAIRKTLQSAGRAMFVTSLVLASGFFVFCFSEIHNLTNFGFLTGIAISLALVADFLLAPALMIPETSASLPTMNPLTS